MCIIIVATPVVSTMFAFLLPILRIEAFRLKIPVPTSPANNDYKPGFSAALMLKDLRLSQEAALSSGASTPLGAEAAQLYALFEKLGNGGRDFSAIIEMFREAG